MGGSTPTSPPPLLSAAPETPELWTNQGCPALCSKTGQILTGTRGPHLCAYVFQRVWLNHQCPGMLAWETKLVALARPRAGAASLASLGPQSHMGPSASSSPSVGSLMPWRTWSRLWSCSPNMWDEYWGGRSSSSRASTAEEQANESGSLIPGQVPEWTSCVTLGKSPTSRSLSFHLRWQKSHVFHSFHRLGEAQMS